jgi:aminopeptidase N
MGRFALRSTVFVTLATTVAGLLLAGTAAAAPAPGGQTVGDPYYPTDGNTGYDVGHYDLRVQYQPSTDQLSGTATILATATQDLSQFSFDFGLHTDSVLVNNVPATYSSTGAKLVITPATYLAKGSPVTVVVRYDGIPSQVTINGEQDWLRTPDGAQAVQEPHMAAFWYPANDHPTDKATYDVSVAVPDGTQVISNGTLVSSPSKLGQTRWNWRSTKPQATYLTFIAIGKYEIRRTTGPDGKPVISAYSTAIGANRDAAIASVERTPEVLAWESSLFGPFPFEAEGGVVPGVDFGFALETQTRPVYTPAFFNGGSDVSVIVHENAHQWFGDAVSVNRWSNIWLNEGFASYAEWLWSEKEGEGTAQQLFDYYYNLYPASDARWQILTGDPGEDHQFSGFGVYTRGALALHALRTTVGDDNFFAILKAWVASREYSDGTIDQFIGIAEKISGKPLHDLFQQWLFTPAKPAVASSFAAHATPAKPKSVTEIDRTQALLASTKH